MNIFLVGCILIIFIYLYSQKKESFDDIKSATTIIASYLNSSNPTFLGYSKLINNFGNTSDRLITRNTFYNLLSIAKLQKLTANDIIAIM